MESKELLESIKKAIKGIWKMLPVLLGVLMLITLADSFIPKTLYSKIFSGNWLIDPLLGGVLGSIFATNPITSYVIGGELVNNGVSLVAVTAFIVAWVTVGLVQLPAESVMLGKRFAIMRNASSFVLAIIVAIFTVMVVNLL